MSKALYDVVGGTTHKTKKVYGVLDGVTRKIKKSYDVVGGKTKQFYSAEAFGSYSGTYTKSTVKIDGVAHDLYTLTGSGTLVLQDSAKAWLCGGGAGGMSGYSVRGGGGGGYTETTDLGAGSYVIIIGAGGSGGDDGHIDATVVPSAGSPTQIKDVITANGGGLAFVSRDSNYVSYWNGGAGGSGGGPGGKIQNEEYGTSSGAGISTYPFGVTGLAAHCAGGGGGAYYRGSYSNGKNAGYAGGSNGSNHGNKASDYKTVAAGGTKGGGAGGIVSSGKLDGKDATFYGSGGGGGAMDYDEYEFGLGGAGYQGVVYIAVPA